MEKFEPIKKPEGYMGGMYSPDEMNPKHNGDGTVELETTVIPLTTHVGEVIMLASNTTREMHGYAEVISIDGNKVVVRMLD
jgi:hypothetical protein